MKKAILAAMAAAVTSLPVCSQGLEGFLYGNATAPDGTEWQSVEKLSLNKEQPHAYLFSFADTTRALQVLPEGSEYYTSLNGTWKFHWSSAPEGRAKGFEAAGFDASAWDDIRVPSSWNIVGIQKDGKHKYGIPMYINQGSVFYHELAKDDWKKGVMRVPPERWTAYKYRNEVGQYVRTFQVPATWKGRRVYVNFDGVDSFFYLWVNGRYVGFSKNSRCLAQFDITPYLAKKGSNKIAVEVYRSSDGSFLETQDMFRMSGIIRSVYLTSKPELQIRDLNAFPDLDDHNINGALNVKASVSNLTRKSAKGYSVRYALYPVKLYSDEIDGAAVARDVVPLPELATKGGHDQVVQLTVAGARPWSAEKPWRYVLTAEILDKRGRTVDVVSTYTGLRKVEIRDTPASKDEFGKAGRYFYVNGRTVKLKGVNRHETCPDGGHVVTRERMLEEVMLMKRANINHVRGSHYPDDPYWYYLCDKYGIYLEDEGNIESHLYFYGKASLSHVPEMRAAHVARDMEMVHADVNHPSIVIWSLGNEAGPGDNFKACYSAIKSFDSTRPVQYERNNDIVDMGSNQYPSIDWVRSAVKGNAGIKYPYHISEYGHSMGNATGNLVDYWDAIESTNFFCGGAIWEWVDHGVYDYTPSGQRYIAYGGDFSDYPNDGTFCLDGVMFADLKPKPQYFEVKKVYQNISVKANTPLDKDGGRIEVMNKNYFEPADFDVVWQLYENGSKIADGKLPNTKFIPARSKGIIPVRFDRALLKADKEYFLKVQFLLPDDMPWAKRGYVQAEEQLPVRKIETPPASPADASKGKPSPTLKSAGGATTIEGEGFRAEFDDARGTLRSLTYGGRDIISGGEGPTIDAFRAPLDNDNWAYGAWYANGLNDLRQSAIAAPTTYKRADGSVVVAYKVKAQAPQAYTRRGGESGRIKVVPQGKKFGDGDFSFNANLVWTIYPEGSVELETAITSNNPSLVLPRLGMRMRVPQSMGKYTWYGRGPINNYNDRKTGQMIERHESTVKAQFLPFGKPQSMSNDEEVRWCALTDDSGTGAVFVSTAGSMSTSALAYSEQALDTAAHPYQLPPSGDTYLHLDCGVTGIGGNSCGQGGPLDPDRVKAGAHSFGFIIRPVAGNIDKQAAVSSAGDAPLLISRSKQGEVSIVPADGKEARLLYSVGGGRAKAYAGPFQLLEGGAITAWTAGNAKLKTAETFAKIDRIPTEVVFASSVETGGDEGDAAHLTDGDPDTYWHTMYSVTVAKYPHWVDFDAGTAKMITGFTYLPRQNSRNGRIKGYKVQFSMDGKTWGEPVAEGEFADNASEKRVTFPKPVKARYMRFTALSSCDGQDFATGAEIGILSE